MRSTRRRAGAKTAAAVLAVALSLVGAARALASEPAPPSTTAPLHRLGVGAERLRLSGETDARDIAVYLSAAEARTHAHLHLAVTNAVSVMAEASRLKVFVNDVLVSETPIASPTRDDPGLLDIDLPPSLLEPGYNALRIEMQARHRVDCSLGATYELWTQIDPATAGFTFEGLAERALSDLADLPALPPAEDGSLPVRLVVPPGSDAEDLDRLLRAAEAVTLRGHFTHPAIEAVTAPAERPGLDIVAGTAEALKRAGLAALLPDDGAGLALRAGAVPGHAILVLSGETPADLEATLRTLASPQAGEPIGTPAGQRVAGLVGGRPVEGHSVVTLRDLGVPSQEFSGRLFRAGFDLLLPPDFYPADYGTMALRLDAAYAAGLVPGSQILLRVNGHDAASLRLANRAGDAFRRRLMSVPLSALRPGLNHVTLEAELATAADRSCDAAATIAAAGGAGAAGGKRFALLDTSTIELPEIARIARMPSLSALAGTGFPYAGGRGTATLLLPHPDAEAISAAATLVSRTAAAAGSLLDVKLALGRVAPPAGSALVIGTSADLPSDLVAAAGLDAEAMRSAWSHVEARSAAAARLRAARAASGGSSATPDDHTDAALFRRWSRDVSAGQWRFEPGRWTADLLETLAGLGPANLPRLWRAEDRVAVTPAMRLAVAQSEAPGRGGETLTLVVAPTGQALQRSVLALTGSERWSALDGRVATFDPSQTILAITPSGADYFIPTAPLSPGNLRLIAAGWLSSEIEAYVLAFLLLALLLGAATTAVVRRHGVKP